MARFPEKGVKTYSMAPKQLHDTRGIFFHHPVDSRCPKLDNHDYKKQYVQQNISCLVRLQKSREDTQRIRVNTYKSGIDMGRPRHRQLVFPVSVHPSKDTVH